MAAKEAALRANRVWATAAFEALGAEARSKYPGATAVSLRRVGERWEVEAVVDAEMTPLATWRELSPFFQMRVDDMETTKSSHLYVDDADGSDMGLLRLDTGAH